MNKEVHKEHLDQLESRLSTVSQSVEKWGEEAFCQRGTDFASLSCLPPPVKVTNIAQILSSLNDSVKRLETRISSTPQATRPG